MTTSQPTRLNLVEEPILRVGPWEVKEMVLTWDKVEHLWETMKKYKTLFSDLTRNDFSNFFKSITRPNTLWFEVWNGNSEIVGLVWLSDIEMTVDGSAHMVFFDRQPAEKQLVCQALIKWVFKHYPLHRVTVTTPAIYFATQRMLRRMGFTLEGTKREAVLMDGKWVDVQFYGMTRNEVEVMP